MAFVFQPPQKMADVSCGGVICGRGQACPSWALYLGAHVGGSLSCRSGVHCPMRVIPALMSFGEKYVLLFVSLKSTECQQLSRGAWSVLGGRMGASFRNREKAFAEVPKKG